MIWLIFYSFCMDIMIKPARAYVIFLFSWALPRVWLVERKHILFIHHHRKVPKPTKQHRTETNDRNNNQFVCISIQSTLVVLYRSLAVYPPWFTLTLHRRPFTPSLSFQSDQKCIHNQAIFSVLFLLYEAVLMLGCGVLLCLNIPLDDKTHTHHTHEHQKAV